MLLKGRKLASAIQYNRNRAKRIGWLDNFGGVLKTLGITSDDVTGSEFAIAVSNWQPKHNLTSDGKIGPNTWRKMQKESVTTITNAILPGWLTVKSLFCNDQNREFNKAGDFSWSIYKYDTDQMSLEIDIKPFQIPDHKLLNLVFKRGVIPNGITVNWNEKQGCSARAIITFGKNTKPTNLAVVSTPTFAFLFTHQPTGMQVGWEARARANMLAHNKLLMAKQEFLGGRSYFDIIQLGTGVYEIPFIGFIYYGMNRTYGMSSTAGSNLEIQTQPSVSVDEDIRWYLERGTDLKQAVYLIDAQGKNINRQLIGIAILTIAGAGAVGSLSKLKVPGTLSKYATTTASALKRTKVIKTGLKAEIMKHFSSSKVESTIQQLKNKPRINIKRLNIIH